MKLTKFTGKIAQPVYGNTRLTRQAQATLTIKERIKMFTEAGKRLVAHRCGCTIEEIYGETIDKSLFKSGIRYPDRIDLAELEKENKATIAQMQAYRAPQKWAEKANREAAQKAAGPPPAKEGGGEEKRD